MGMRSSQYQTVVASLPPLPADFEQPHVPISRPRLESRLRMLPEEEQDLLDAVERFWRWERQRVRQDPLEVYRDLVSRVDDRDLLECIQVLVDIRMLTAAVRARISGRGPGALPGRWAEHVVRFWDVPDFGLALRFPWLPEFKSLLENRAYTDAERRVSGTVWQAMTRAAEQHYFDLTVILAYLIRWDIINRWAVRERTKGLERFSALVEEVIGSHAAEIE